MSLIRFNTTIDAKDLARGVDYHEETDTLFQILEVFACHHIEEALREYFALCKNKGYSIPDFINQEVL